MRMTRIWMTGCMALVLLAAGRWPVREEVDADPRERTRITQGAVRIGSKPRVGVDEILSNCFGRERLGRQASTR